jgi:hypothetical protein
VGKKSRKRFGSDKVNWLWKKQNKYNTIPERTEGWESFLKIKKDELVVSIADELLT